MLSRLLESRTVVFYLLFTAFGLGGSFTSPPGSYVLAGLGASGLAVTVVGRGVARWRTQARPGEEVSAEQQVLVRGLAQLMWLPRLQHLSLWLLVFSEPKGQDDTHVHLHVSYESRFNPELLPAREAVRKLRDVADELQRRYREETATLN